MLYQLKGLLIKNNMENEEIKNEEVVETPAEEANEAEANEEIVPVEETVADVAPVVAEEEVAE